MTKEQRRAYSLAHWNANKEKYLAAKRERYANDPVVRLRKKETRKRLGPGYFAAATRRWRSKLKQNPIAFEAFRKGRALEYAALRKETPNISFMKYDEAADEAAMKGRALMENNA